MSVTARPTRIRSRYEPIARPEQGGQSEVVKAIDHDADRLVAIKIRTLGDNDETLRREARILRSLPAHPNLPLVLDEFFDAGRHHLVMEWIEGRTLGDLIASEGPMPPGRALAILDTVAAALTYLHERRPPIVHGDVKPDNIIVRRDDSCVLVDLGIALSGGDARAASGTAHYRAPDGRPSPATDVYSLAATVLSTLTGAPPGGGAADWSGVPERSVSAVERAIRAGLATDPAVRPASAGRLLQRVRAALDGDDTAAGMLVYLVALASLAPGTWEARRTREIAESVAFAGGGRLIADEAIAAAFRRPLDAIVCAAEIERRLGDEPWPSSPPMVRGAIVVGGAAELEAQSAIDAARRLAGSIDGHGFVAAGELAAPGELPEGVALDDLGVRRPLDLSPAVAIARVRTAGQAAEPLVVRSLDPSLTNLPVLPTTFVGRGADVAAIAGTLPPKRFVTLVGPGGSGKTRLALHAAASLAPSFADGVWLVELAGVTDAAMVPAALAAAVGVRDDAADLPAALAHHFDDRKLVLILDNCEHVATACAALADRLIGSCDGLAVLATSRQALGSAAESIYEVAPLPLPEGTDIASPAVRLFAERAAAVAGDFILDEETAHDAARIVRAVDGLPLAIELAAALAATATTRQIARRIEDRFSIPASGSAGAPARHRTLRAMIDWSHESIDPPERAVFWSLSVFSGGFDTASAALVCARSREHVSAAIARLAAVSLVVRHGTGGRYRMLETLRQYGRERLVEAGQSEASLRRHAVWCESLAREAWPGLQAGDAAWLDRLDAEHDNIRAALGWSIRGGERALALGIVGCVYRYWQLRGHLVEGRQWCDQVLRAFRGDDIATAHALCAAGVLARYQQDDAAAREHLDEALTIARAAGDDDAIALILTWLAFVEGDRERLDSAHAFMTEAIPIWERLDDDWGLASAHNFLGEYERLRNRFDAARPHYAEVHRIGRRMAGKAFVAMGLVNLGFASQILGEHDRAERELVAGLSVAEEEGLLPMIAYAVEGLATAAVRRGNPRRAARLFAAVLAFRDQIGFALGPEDAVVVSREIDAIRAATSESDFEAESASGRSLGREDMVAEALAII